MVKTRRRDPKHVVIGLCLSLLLVGTARTDRLMLAEITEPVVGDFGTYYPIPVSVEPSVEPWSIEPDLSNVANAEDFNLTDRERALLIQNSFVVIPGSGYAEVYDPYNENRDNGIPSFVSADAVLHTYHVLFDHLLKRAELDRLFPALVSANDTLVRAATATQAEAAGQEELKSARLLLAFHSVARGLLDSSYIPDPSVSSLVEEELSLINNHQHPAISPIFGVEEDYTQYEIRGHYTTSDTLGSYFRAMMWYGRMTFVLDAGCEPQRVMDHTRAALFLVRDMARHPACHSLWNAAQSHISCAPPAGALLLNYAEPNQYLRACLAAPADYPNTSFVA